MTSEPYNKPEEKSYLSAAVESISPWSTSRTSTPTPGPAPGDTPASKSKHGGDFIVNRRNFLSSRSYPNDCPPLRTQWFYAVDVPKRKPRLLKQSPKESTPFPPPKKYAPFSSNDSRSIEAAFQRLVEEEEEEDRLRSGDRVSPKPSTRDHSRENTSIDEAGNLEQGDLKINVLVNEDFLFDVDIEKRELAPVYWLGPIYEVRRGTWFYQDSSVLKPCEENLATQLEERYLKVKPFRYPKTSEKANPRNGDDRMFMPTASTNADPADLTPRPLTDKLHAGNKQALDHTSSNTRDIPPPPPHEPQTHRLFGSYMNSVVTYQDESTAWLLSDGIMSRVSSTVYQRFAGGAHFGGVKLVRGFTDLSKASKLVEPKLERPPTPITGKLMKPSNPGLQLDERQQRILKHESASAGTKGSDDEGTGHKQTLSETQEAALKRHISYMGIDLTDPEKVEDAVRIRDEKEIQTDYVEHEGEDQARKIEHLILVTHGIGQRLGMRTESVNFIHDVNILRQTLKSVYSNSADLQALNSEVEKLPKNCKIQVLPVCWRHLLDFPRKRLRETRKEHDLGDTSEEDENYPSLEDITVEGVPFVRSLITDLALDILLYQSAYREHITSIVLQECNRIYELFLKRHPYFDGKVSLIGHSLGSAILFDILCRQKEDVELNRSSQHSRFYHPRPIPRTQIKRDGKDLSFAFPVEDFYCLGSPLGLFQMLKGRTIAARHYPGAFPAESPMDMDSMDDPFLAASNPTSRYSAGEKISSTTGLPYNISSPKCAQLYNIFHPSDPISYRLEPLIAPAMAALKPQALPYTKKGLFGASASQGLTGIGAKVGQSVSGFWSSLSSGIASSLINRSLGPSGEEVASMVGSPPSAPDEHIISAGVGTNISSSGIISDKPMLKREHTDEKKRKIAEDTAAANRAGNEVDVPTLIDDEIETLYSGFQKRNKGHATTHDGERPGEWLDADEKGQKLRKEESKVRALNRNGRVDFSIQEGVLDFNPINTIASHLSYWADEDVSHFVMSQLLSRRRRYKSGETSKPDFTKH